MKKRIIITLAVAAMVGASHAALFTSGFDDNTGAHIFAGNTDNTTGSATVTITDWTTDLSVTSISGLTAIHPAEGGGFAQTQGGAGTYAGPNNIYLSRNHNLEAAGHGYSLTFTIDTSWDLTTLTVLSGHSNDAGTQNQNFTSDLNFSLSGGTLTFAVTGLSSENYGTTPAYHSVAFDLTGTTIGAGTYTLKVYQNNNEGGSYAIYDGITLDFDNGAQPPAITSFDASSTNVFAGETITLTWATIMEDSLSLDQGIGDVTGMNQVDVMLSADTIYSLIAVNGNGSVTSSVFVAVNTASPVIHSFTVMPVVLATGKTVTLSWSVEHEVDLNVDQGVGDVLGLTSTQMVVHADTTYLLYAGNPNGITTASATVVIGEPDPLVAHYKLDETSGTTVLDSSNNASVGTVADGSNLSAIGISNTGISILRAGPVQAESVFVENEARTLSVWFYSTGIRGQDRIVGKGQGAGEQFDVTFEVVDSKNSIGLRYGNGNMFWSGSAENGQDIQENMWNHIVISYDGTTWVADASIQVYLNGILLARDGGNNKNSGQTLNTDTNDFFIGSDFSARNLFHGSIDDVQVYDVAVEQSDVDFLFSHPGLSLP